MGSTLTYKLAEKSQYYFSIAKKNPNIFSNIQNTNAFIFIADSLST